LRGARIGVWRILDQGSGVDAVLSSTVDILAAAGARPIPVELPYQHELGEVELPSMWAEFRDGLARYLATRPGAPRNLAELIEFNVVDPIELSRFGQDHFEAAAAAPPLTDPGYLRGRERATDLARRSIDEPMATHGLDAIVVPSNGPAWLIDYDAGDKDEIGSSSPAAVAGYPTVTVPAGFDGPLPIGVSFITARYSDQRALALAAAFEQASQARRPPTYLPTLADQFD
jgi:amidase